MGGDTEKGAKQGWLRSAALNVPGILLCVAIAIVAWVFQEIETRVFAHPYIEALVIAILLGMAVRTAWTPGQRWRSGINTSAKFLLEIAVVLLGASISLGAIVASGPALLIGIVAAVILALAASYATSRILGLSRHIAILVACGNSICGNSAIVAVAPVIDADGHDVASSIAFTAILGVVVVLALPLAFPLLGLSETQYGVLAGLTVYAVPQVLAATVPISLVSTQVGTLVKLTRVLMLGPVVVMISLFRSRFVEGEVRSKAKLGLAHLVPWFILGFLVLATLRSMSLVPDAAVRPLTTAAGLLTIISMAALGLGVDVRSIGRIGGRVTAAVVISLVVLLAISLALIRLLKIA
jgi:uncharacterized integral membrane protein (TIGR00698 family)